MAAALARRIVACCVGLAFISAAVAPAFAAPRKKPAKPGFVIIDSPIEGASIEIDGVAMGLTPAPPISIPAGSHAIKVSKRGFLPVLDVVVVKPGQETKFSADLFAEKCVLKVTSPVEGAEVFLDGKILGETPIDTDIDPGRRSLRVNAQGYRDFVQVIDAVAGETTTIDAVLESLTPTPPPGSVKAKAEKKPKRWYKKWWVWAIAGGAATAVVVGAAAASGDEDPIGDFGPDREFAIP